MTVDGAAPAAVGDILIEQITTAEDIEESLNPICDTFGLQTLDAFWMAMNPGWDTPEGKARCASLMVQRWRATTKDLKGRPNTVYLKATAPSSNGDGSRTIVGTATWIQASNVAGHGDAPTEDLSKAVDLNQLYPGDATEQRYLCQVIASLQRERRQAVREKMNSSPPSAMVLDLCVVHPAYQGRGIAKRLVQWGLDEAKARGGLECLTEGSVMGRRVYEKLGFRSLGEIEYVFDDEFAGRRQASNVFMRTGI